MDPRQKAVLPHGPSTMAPPPPATVRRRLSMDEDLYYQRVMTEQPRRPSRPPPYEVDGPRIQDDKSMEERPPAKATETATAKGRSKSRWKGKGKDDASTSAPADAGRSGLHRIPDTGESLPAYSSSIELNGIFMKKHEIEDTIKRAEDRRWHTTFVTLTGTALNLYTVKKNRSWGRTREDGPTISPDNPPWMRKSKLEKSYSLLYADAGIAADYKKRRYVIRVRAETDQFLLSCIELSTFNMWLEGLFAAIDVALPIDDRDFPRDMSIPRMQRVRWYRGITGVQGGIVAAEPAQQDSQQEMQASEPSAERSAGGASETNRLRRRSSTPDALPTLYQADALPTRSLAVADEVDGDQPTHALGTNQEEEGGGGGRAPASSIPRLDPAHRLSTSSYYNVGVDPHSGKWVPDHRWTSAHDLLYAKLCYSNLLFRSPRKSNYIIRQGKKWYVDWTTGRMVRVLPPTYGEVDYFGPWQVIHTENMRI